MAQKIQLPQLLIPAGNYSHEIDAPARANSARLTMTRPGSPLWWPIGDVFTWRVYERERNGVLQLLCSGTEKGSGADITGRDGASNPPLTLTMRWPVDRDKDHIRIELDVLQAFTTAVTLEFL